MMQEDRQVGASPRHFDRRRSPRLEVLGRVQGELRGLDRPVRLVNLSDNGFMMEAPIDFAIGSSHDFKFSATGAYVVLSARVVHAAARATAEGNPTYVVGLEFEQDDAAIEYLVGLLTD